MLKEALSKLIESNARTKFYVGFVVAFVIGIYLFMSLTLSIYQQRHLNNVSIGLEIKLNTTNQLLKDWIDARIGSLSYWVNSPKVKPLLLNIVEGKNRQKNTLKLREYFRPVLESRTDQGFFVINKDYLSLASMRNVNTGSRNIIAYHYPRRLQRVFEGESLAIPPIQSDIPLPHSKTGGGTTPTLFLLTPVKNDKGEVVAAFSIRLNPYTAFYKLVSNKSSSKTGETYFFDRRGVMLTPSRFENDLRKLKLSLLRDGSSALKVKLLDPGADLTVGDKPVERAELWPFTYAVQRGIRGEKGVNAKGYRDYRGVEVLGAWNWNETYGFGIVTEVDKREALESFYEVRRITQIVFYVLTLLALSLMMSVLWLESNSKKVVLRAKDIAEEANLLKDKFLSLVAHDLKTPIGVISGYSEILMEDELEPRERRELLLRIDDMSSKMHEMIDGLLSLSRIRMGKIDIQLNTVNLHEMVREVLSEVHFFADRKKIHLENLILPTQQISCDHKLFLEVLRNLASNAIKFCQKEDSISFKYDPERMQLTVEDTGKGISSDRLEHLFEYSAKTSTRGTSGEVGSGLGLPLCKDIIEAHGGTISVRSPGVGQGTVFTIVLNQST